MGKGETERDGLKNRTTCIDGAMKRTDIEAVRHKVASNGGPFVLLLTRSLLADPLAIIAMIAAFDLARPIVGVYCDGLDGGNFVYEAFDDLDDFLNRNHPDTLKTLKEHGIDVERDGHKCLVILRHAAEDGPKNAIIRINVQDNVDVPESSRLSRDVRALATLEPAEKLNELRRALDVKVPRAVKGRRTNYSRLKRVRAFKRSFGIRIGSPGRSSRVRSSGCGAWATKGRSRSKEEALASTTYSSLTSGAMARTSCASSSFVSRRWSATISGSSSTWITSSRAAASSTSTNRRLRVHCQATSILTACARRSAIPKEEDGRPRRPRSNKGGLSRDEIREIESACDNLEKWGLADELAKWKPPMTPPSG